MNYSRVEGHEHLLRDLKTGAIVNTNLTEYENYINMKKLKESEVKKFNKIENEVMSLKNDLSEIKDLLRGLLYESR
jgi:flagellar biosynthesis component FlhA